MACPFPRPRKEGYHLPEGKSVDSQPERLRSCLICGGIIVVSRDRMLWLSKPDHSIKHARGMHVIVIIIDKQAR